jgi:hypothetical protein
MRAITLAVVVAALMAGCGGAGTRSTSTSVPTSTRASVSTSVSARGASSHGAFGWLRPAATPAGWSAARLGDSAVLVYPHSWHRIHSDPGTISAVLTDAGDLIRRYVNATPQQGEETLQNWATFRPDHNREEGDSHVQVLAAARGLRFRDGRGSCVIDRYRTPRASYQEIACLVKGPRGGNVIVAAAPADEWAQAAPVLERSVSSFLA